MLRQILALALVTSLMAGCTPSDGDLDQELDELLRALPGVYVGEAPIGPQEDGAMRTLFHKFAPIDAPQLGDRALYYQISAEGADGAALQMKIFVFDTDPERVANRMRAYVFAPGQAAGNLELDPDRWTALDPETLMTFPAQCAFLWSEIEGGFNGESGAPDCVYQSRAFEQTIRPRMSYRILGDRFEMEENLFGEDGQAIVSTNGVLPAFRE